MNLDTAPVERKNSVGGFCFNKEGNLVPLQFEVFHSASNFDGELVKEVLESYQNMPWKIHGYSDGADEIFQSSKTFNTNSMGSMRETLENEIRITIWKAYMEKYGSSDGFMLSLRPMAADRVCIGLDGLVRSLRVEFVFDSFYRDSCATCQQGKNLLQYSVEQLRDTIVLFNEDRVKFNGDGLKFKFGEKNSVILKKFVGKTVIIDSDGLPLESVRRWFTEANAGAIEMAHVSQVLFIEI